MKSINVADWIVNWLAQKGVKDIFTLPGGGSMYLNHAVNISNKVRAIPCQHEQACGIAAEAYGRISSDIKSSNFGVAIVTCGPGATNIITPVTGAWLESLPLLIISGQVKTSDINKDKLIRQSGTQEVDVISLAQNITKYSITITDINSIPYHLNLAYERMLTGRKGPVWLDIPLDIQGSKCDFPDEFLPSISKKVKSNIDYNNILNLIFKSQRPVILLGHGVRLSGALKELKVLLFRLKIPVLLTWPAIDYLAYDDLYNLGCPGVVAGRHSNFTLQNSDLLISIGARLDNSITAYNPAGFASNAFKIVVDIDGNELINKEKMNINIPIALDSKLFIENLLKFPYKSNPIHKKWLDKCIQWKNLYSNEKSKSSSKKSISHLNFINFLSKSLSSNNQIVTGSSGLAIEFFYARFRPKSDQRIIHTSGLGSMGYALPAGIGACIKSNLKTYIIESDGSFQLNIQELATLTSLQLPITIIIMNNGGYASIRNSQSVHFNGNFSGCDVASGLFFPNLSVIASAYNIKYERITSLAGADKIMKKYTNFNKPLILEFILSHGEALEPKCAAIRNSEGKIISMPLEDMTPLLTIEKLKEEMFYELNEKSLTARLI